MLEGILIKEGDTVPQNYDFAIVRLLRPDVRDGYQMDDQQSTQNRRAAAEHGTPTWGYFPYNYDESDTAKGGWGALSGYKQAIEYVRQYKKGLSSLAGIIVGFHYIMSPNNTTAKLPNIGTYSANFANIAKVIMDGIGKPVIVYSTPSFIASLLDEVPNITNYPLMIAHYAAEPHILPWKNWAFWEYAGTSNVENGKVSGRVRFNGTKEQLSAFAMTGKLETAVSPTPVPVTVPNGTIEERVKRLEDYLREVQEVNAKYQF